MSRKTLSPKGRAWLKALEGVRRTAYFDTKGLPTIGVGTHIDTQEEQYLKSKTLTDQEIEDLFTIEINRHKVPVDELLKSGVKLTQSEYDALVSLVFNLGVGGFRKLSMYTHMIENPNNFSVATVEKSWSSVQPYGGRRKAEIRLFKEGVYVDSLNKPIKF